MQVMDEGIMETVSDNTAVKKRGRPRVLNAEEEAH
jgi:hypothetical protein